MEELLSGLHQIFISLEIVDTQNSKRVLVFSAACGIAGFVAVLLDLCMTLLRGESPLKLKHGKNTIIFFVVWSIGAFLIGWIGQVANIFVVNVSSVILVGFSWPLLFTSYLKSKADSEIAEEPEQPT